MGMIFYASTGTFSAAHTSRFIEPFLRWITRGRISETAIQNVHFFIRKCCHVGEYAILAILTRNAFQKTVYLGTDPTNRSGEWSVSGYAFVVATIYAAGDEFHQSFVPSRGASVHDVMIDALGALIGLALVRSFQKLRQRSAEYRLHPGKS